VIPFLPLPEPFFWFCPSQNHSFGFVRPTLRSIGTEERFTFLFCQKCFRQTERAAPKTLPGKKGTGQPAMT
jgi:hypothetical protein